MLNNFSPNMLKTYQTCPKKFYYRYIEKISIPKALTPFEKGKKIHALANYFLKGINISRIETALNTQEKIIWEKLLNNKYFKMDCIKTEFPIQIKLSEFWIGGRIDAIVQNGTDYFILDYKTGSVPQNPMFDFQTMVYLLCVDKYLKSYNSLKFVYIDLKKEKDLIIDFSKDTKTQYAEIIYNNCQKISNDIIYECCQNPKECSLCEYQKICTSSKTLF